MTSQELVVVRQKTQEAIEYFRAPQVLEQITYALPEGESPHKFVRTLATALMENQDLVTADRNSLITAVFKAAQMNLLPDGREAVINVYNTKVKVDGKDAWIQKATLIPMVDGYAKNVAEYGWSIVADVVYENDTFDEGSTEKPLFHQRARLGTDRGQPIGAFALAKHSTLGFRQEIFSVEQIEEVRKTSKQPNGQLWTKWWDRAWRKTMAKQVAKRLPLNSADKERLQPLLAAEDTNGADDIDTLYGDRPDAPPVVPAVARAGEAAPQSSASPPPNVNPETGEIIEEKPPLSDDDIPFGDETPAVPFDGEEPPEEVEGEIVDEPTFTSGRHEGMTVEQVWALGEKGESYIRWAFKQWKTGEIVAALEAFAAAHPEVTE